MATPLPIKSVNHLARTTRRLDESRSFYRDVLGFRELRRPNFSFPGAWLYNYGLQIHLIVDDQAPDPNGEISTTADHLALHVDNVDEAKRLLEEHRVSYRENVSAAGIKQLFFRDPDGHHVEIATYPERVPFADEV